MLPARYTTVNDIQNITPASIFTLFKSASMAASIDNTAIGNRQRKQKIALGRANGGA